MATLSYKERMKEERAHATAIRKAREAALRRQRMVISEAHRMSIAIVKDQIRARGEKVTDYSVREINERAEEIAIGPWLRLKAKARVEHYLEVMSISKIRMDRGLLLNETHAQNGATK
jgi:hypothetical protein